ncbi:MAG TPA: acyltransferase family protein [Candidatus Saccharimonadales bacterium]|nr:acyltransferase family protein [Candidatus Saccharimonadales bacterium]
MQNIKNYSYTADAIRILAIILVVVIHIAGGIVDNPSFFQLPAWYFANFIDSASRIAVPIFILLSGALLLHPIKHQENLKSYAIKRLKRVGIPLIVWSGIYLLWNYFFWGHSYSLYQVVSDLLAPNIYYHLYFLYIILGLYLCVPFFRIFLMHVTGKFLKVTLIILFMFTLCIYGVNALFPSIKTTFNGLTLFLPYIPYFLAGPLLWNVYLSKRTFFILSGFYVLLTLFTSVANYVYMMHVGWSTHASSLVYDRYFYDHFSPNVMLMSLFGFILLRNLPLIFTKVKQVWFGSAVMYISPSVFGIYLIHPMIRDVLNVWYPEAQQINFSSIEVAGILVVKIVLVLIISYALVFAGRLFKPLRILFG